MDLLLDTQVLVWFSLGSARMSSAARDALAMQSGRCFVSAITAYEFVDLNRRGRFGADLALDGIIGALDATILPYPAEAWRIAAMLPDLHRDPVDRMLIAHALHADLTLVTADATMRRYPVRTLW